MAKKENSGPFLGVRKKLFRWGLLVAFVFCFLPMPVPPISSSPESGENYPCKGRLCGCRTAHQCWTSCCCTTPAERLAWALENNVNPPALAVLSGQDSQPKQSVESSDSAETHCPYCSPATSKLTLIESDSYCGNKTESSQSKLDQKSKDRTLECDLIRKSDQISDTTAHPEVTTKKNKPKPVKVRFVRVMDSLKCHGLEYSLDLINQCVFPELEIVTSLAGIEESVVDSNSLPPIVYLSITIPPPRV